MQTELEWLRELEQDVQLIFRNAETARNEYGGHAVTVHNLLNSLRIDISGRIIALLARPCNEMGGGSSGLDTADDFAMHCGKEDRHAGPHSYEENR
jgi:hypothetical protein